MIIQLVPPVPLTTSKGDAKAMLYIDRGVDHYGEWVCFILKTGECWTFRDKDIRLWTNETEGRESISPFGTQEHGPHSATPYQGQLSCKPTP